MCKLVRNDYSISSEAYWIIEDGDVAKNGKVNNIAANVIE